MSNNQNSNVNLMNNVNKLFSNFSHTSLNTSQGLNYNFSFENKKSSSTKISNPNTPIKSFSYNEDKNLKFRQSMEDVGITIPDLLNDYKVNLFCIFDGHGGIDVVNFLKNRMSQLIKSNLENLIPVKESISKSFYKIDEELKFYDSDNVGSTATVIIIKDNIIYCGNVGDSKAYIVYKEKVEQISVDHKCINEKEKERIIKCGGKIVKNRVNGQLILSRTLGDKAIKKFGVICEPDINEIKVNNDINFIVLASDGVWDVINDNELFELSKKFKNADEFCKEIVKESIKKGTKDNVSCIVISFIE
jgi:serine/threonine protein phosphatase PrpC